MKCENSTNLPGSSCDRSRFTVTFLTVSLVPGSILRTRRAHAPDQRTIALRVKRFSLNGGAVRCPLVDQTAVHTVWSSYSRTIDERVLYSTYITS